MSRNLRPAARRTALALCAALLFALGCAPPAAAQQGTEHLSIVSLHVTSQPTDMATPWNKRTEQNVRGNALVVGAGLLLTTADLVKNATLIEARKLGRYPDYQAERVRIDYELDLALLSVADPDFWDGLVPMELSTEPIQFGRFVVSRWRSNGRFEQGSGEVVDLRATTSRFGSLELPIMRGTTNMGGLGWAEVMTHEGRVVGLITSHNNSELQATMSPVLAQFAAAASKQPYQGLAHRGFGWQRLNQPALRAYHGLDEHMPGVLITKIYSGGTGSDELREGDILMKLGPYEIDAEGMISHPLYGEMLFPLAINDSDGPKLPARIRRDGREMTLQLVRKRLEPEDYRIPTHAYDAPIDYDVFGGLVLQELNLGYLQAWGDGWQERAPRRLVIEYALRAVREAGSDPEHEVIISRVLPDASNLGYQNLDSAIVTRANGRPVLSLADFREAVRHPEGGFHVIELLPGMGRSKLVFDATQIAEANRRIGERYDVPAPPQIGREARDGEASR